MSLPSPPSHPGTDTISRYMIGGATPGRYQKLIGGGFVRLPGRERATFLQALGRDARQITAAELEYLLQHPNWRPRMAAAWLIGVGRHRQFRERLGTRVQAAEVTYAHQSYCVALALLGTHEDAELLTAYLDRCLREPECRYDEPWALGALLHLDDTLGSNYAGAFLEPGGHRESGASDHVPEPTRLKEHIAELCALVARYAPAPDEAPSATVTGEE